MAHLRHKRDADARTPRRIPRAAKIAAPVAALATASAVSLGVLAAQPGSDLLAGSSAAGSIGSVPERQVSVSRSDARTMYRQAERSLERQEAAQERRATKKAIRQADTKRWTTAVLNLWTDSAKGKDLGVVDDLERVLVTGRKADGRTEIVMNGKARWVTNGYLVAEKPKPPKPPKRSGSGSDGSGESSESSESSEPAAPALGGACTNGTSVSGGANVLAVHEAVCAAFPQITSYGTYRSDGEHSQGLAIDIMVSGGTGWQVAEFIRDNYGELGVNYIMYSQKIWSVDRSGEGWRYVEDRGSSTANHYDHVHVTTY